jgi:hypothetical protein
MTESMTAAAARFAVLLPSDHEITDRARTRDVTDVEPQVS